MTDRIIAALRALVAPLAPATAAQGQSRPNAIPTRQEHPS
jgi:hypothetical protein